jgi:hypothetical protein
MPPDDDDGATGEPASADDGAARELASADDGAAEPASAGEPDVAPDLIARMRDAPGLAPLVAEAVATWRARATAEGQHTNDGDAVPGWRAFTDAFPTFWEFTNRPR